jgi:hypothetical protein
MRVWMRMRVRMHSVPAVSILAVADLGNREDCCAPDPCVFVLERCRQCGKRTRVVDLAERHHDVPSDVRNGVANHGDERVDRCAVVQLTERRGGV